MTWIRLDSSFLEHPKIAELDDRSLRVWLACVAHCNATGRADGFLSDRVLLRLRCTQRMRDLMMTAPPGFTHGLFEEAEGGVRLHDYAHYQPDARRHSEVRAEAGRMGGVASGAARRMRAADAPAARTPSPGRELAARAAYAPGAPFAKNDGAMSSESLESAKQTAEPRPTVRPYRPTEEKENARETDGDPNGERLSRDVGRGESAANPADAPYVLCEHFVEGVRVAGGDTYAMPRCGEMRALGGALALHCAKTPGRWLETAKALGGRWVAYCGGAPGNGFQAKDWLSKGAPVVKLVAGPRAARILQPAPAEGPRYKIGDGT